MLFCCLWRSTESSCRKHFVVVSRHQQTPSLTTSKVSQLAGLWSGGAAVRLLITLGRLGRSQRWHHAVKPDIGTELRFLPTPPWHLHWTPRLGGIPVGILPCCMVWKTRMVWVTDGEKLWRYVYGRDGQTDRQTDTQTDTARRHRLRLHSIARQ